MIKKKCWEFKKCGRETGGLNADEFGICPSSLSNEFNGINNGIFGGRFCWVISGTFCQGTVQGSFAKKLKNCLKCDFLDSVIFEEDLDFIMTPNQAVQKLNNNDELSR